MSVPLYIVESDNIPGSISEENKIRVMVIPIVAILVVTMIVAGYRDEGEQIEIDVDDEDGFGEIIIYDPPDIGEVENYPEKNSTALVYVNNDSYLKFEVDLRSAWTTETRRGIDIKFEIEGEFEDDLDPESLLINTEEISELSDTVSKVDFEFSSLREENLTYSHTRSPWSLGHDIDADEFEISVVLQWKIYHGYQYEDLTLELSAIVEGFSEEVSAVVHVHVEGDEL